MIVESGVKLGAMFGRPSELPSLYPAAAPAGPPSANPAAAPTIPLRLNPTVKLPRPTTPFRFGLAILALTLTILQFRRDFLSFVKYLKVYVRQIGAQLPYRVLKRVQPHFARFMAFCLRVSKWPHMCTMGHY